MTFRTKTLASFATTIALSAALGLTATPRAAMAAPQSAAPAPGASAAAPATDPAAAQALFNDARTLMMQHRYADACPKLEESQKLDPGIGTQWHLASCYERIGRTASAWALYLETAAAAKAAGQPAREKAARDRAAALEPKLSRLTITLHGADPTGLKVTRDGIDVGRGQWNTAMPIDPGEHRVTATAPGKKALEKAVRVPPDAKTVSVEIPPLADESNGGAAAVAVAPPPAAARPSAAPVAAAPARAPQPVAAPPPVATTTTTSHAFTAPPPEPEDRGGAQRTLGWIASGVGLAGLGVGTGFGVLSKQRRDQSNRGHCDADNRCDTQGLSLRREAVTYGNVATAGFIGGGAALLTGIVLLVTAPKNERTASSKTARHVAAAPMLGEGTTGLGVSGRW